MNELKKDTVGQSGTPQQLPSVDVSLTNHFSGNAPFPLLMVSGIATWVSGNTGAGMPTTSGDGSQWQNSSEWVTWLMYAALMSRRSG